MSNGNQVTIPEIEVSFAEHKPQTVKAKELVITVAGGGATFSGGVRFSLPEKIELSGNQKLVVIFEGEVVAKPHPGKKDITIIEMKFGPGRQLK